jgi:hypothetical protein
MAEHHSAQFNSLISDINLSSYKKRKPVLNKTHCSVESSHTLEHNNAHSSAIQVLGSWPVLYTWIMQDVAQHVISVLFVYDNSLSV